MAQIGRPSPIKMLIIHAALWAACLVATFPVLRVVAISFRDTGTISASGDTSFPP